MMRTATSVEGLQGLKVSSAGERAEVSTDSTKNMNGGGRALHDKERTKEAPHQESLRNFLELSLASASDVDSDVPLLYHVCRRPGTIKHVVLSLTATEKVYEALTPESALFLHRPWNLVRHRLGPSNSVFASHKAFDEILTTGHNLPLMRCFGARGNRVPIIGYKSTPERKMGSVSKIPPQSMAKWADFINKTFALEQGTQDVAYDKEAIPTVLACMNGFDPDLIDRAIAAAASLFPAWPHPDGCRPQDILYLTGETRTLGADYAALRGIQVVYTGHRNAELWGLHYLATRLQEGWPALEVSIVDEAEEEKRMEAEKKAADQVQARNRRAEATNANKS